MFRVPQKISIMQELLYSDQLLNCCYDYNGNHVVQKIIIEMGQIDPHDRNSMDLGITDFNCMIQVINSQIVPFCLNEYCCRIVQRMFEYCNPELIDSTARIIVQNFDHLC